MKREDLIKLGLSEEQADAILAMRGKEVTDFQNTIKTLETEKKNSDDLLTKANERIASFGDLDSTNKQLKKDVEKYKLDYDNEVADKKKQIDQVKFDYALDESLRSAHKVRDPKTIKPLLKMEDLKHGEDGSIIGLEDQVKKLRESPNKEHEYLFSDAKEVKITGKMDKQNVISDVFVESAKKAAGIQTQENNTQN